MRKRSRVVPILLFVAALLSASSAGPVAAVDAADFLVWRFAPPGPRGLGMVHARPTNTTLVAETVGLRPNSTYTLVASTARCGEVHQAANVVWSKALRSNSKGAVFIDTILGDDDLVPTVASIRLFQGSDRIDCAKSLRYQSGGGGGPTDAFTTFSAFGARAMVFVDLGSRSDKLTAVGHGFISSHGYRLVGSEVACPGQPSSPTTLFEKMGTTNRRGILWRHDTGGSFGTQPPRSIQLFNGATRVACSPTTALPAVQ